MLEKNIYERAVYIFRENGMTPDSIRNWSILYRVTNSHIFFEYSEEINIK